MRRLIALLGLCCALWAAAPAPEDEVRAAMEAWRQARIHKDGKVLDRLYAPDLTYMHSTGKLENKKEGIDAIVNGKEKIESLEFKGLSIRVYGNTATARVEITLRTTTDGQSTTLVLATLHIWVKNPSGWQLVARQATRLNP